MPSTTRKRKTPSTIRVGALVNCRNAIWRFVAEEGPFWKLELVRQGPHFTDTANQVWALPELETVSLETPESALAPVPTIKQAAKTDALRPFVYARSRQLLGARFQKERAISSECAIELKPWQFAPWERISDELPFPRLLLADDVGLGKTTEAAIILAELTRRRRAERVLIIAPQNLTEKWQRELYQRFGLAFEIFDRDSRQRLAERGVRNPWSVVEKVIVSRDFLKRWENLKPLQNVHWDMIVIDEAHHFVKEQHTSPTRLRELAESIVYQSPGLLLLSATPYTGEPSEFQSLLQLLDPKFFGIKRNGWDPQNPYLLRRLKREAASYGETILSRKVTDIEITSDDLLVLEREVLQDVTDVLKAKVSERSAGVFNQLLEETVRKRLSSSWAAFLKTISTENGQIRSWFSDAVRSKVQQLAAPTQGTGKATRVLDLIRSIRSKDPKAKVLIFTESVDTAEFIAEYLQSNLSTNHEKVALLVGSTEKGKRREIEFQFSSVESDLAVLVATDTVSEGKDLQHACHHLIHWELPWSLVRIEQRNGRIDRLGQTKPPHIYNLILNTEATSDQRVMGALEKRARAASEALGSMAPILERVGSLDLRQLERENEILAKVEEAKKEYEEFGFGTLPAAPLSSAPVVAETSVKERETFFKAMLAAVGGSLNSHGRIEREYLLALPDGWDFPGLEAMDDHPPTEGSPWPVTFDASHFLEWERATREQGDALRPLHYLSPLHPVVLQVESRFRQRLTDNGYPVFNVENCPRDWVLWVELTARSPSGRIAAQKSLLLSADGRNEWEPSVLGDISPARGAPVLPSERVWKTLLPVMEERATRFAREMDAEFKERRRKFETEDEQIDPKAPGKQERALWIDEIWRIDTSQPYFQIIALLCAAKGGQK